MSERPPRLPPPANPALPPVLTAVVYVAAVVALWGILSLLLDREVVDYPDAGPLLGPAMAAAAAVVTWVALLCSRRSRSPWPWTALALVLSLAAMLLVALLGHGALAPLHFLIAPFVPAAAVLSAVTVLVSWALRPRRNI